MLYRKLLQIYRELGLINIHYLLTSISRKQNHSSPLGSIMHGSILITMVLKLFMLIHEIWYGRCRRLSAPKQFL